VLGAARLAPDQLREAIRAIKAQTDQPFGVNFLLAPPESSNQDVPTVQHFLDHFRQELQIPNGRTDLTLPPSRLPQQLEIVFDEQVPVLSIG
jgi:nitronate monooxygenase